MYLPTSKTHWKLASALAAALLIIWLSYGFFVAHLFCDWPTRGQFGDMYGALACLFSLLAFGGVLYTLVGDREEKRKESNRAVYESLLVSIEHQLKAAQSSGSDILEIADLYAKQRYYSESLEELLTERKLGPLLSDSDIINAFATIGWFNKADLSKDLKEIRRRLGRWRITDPKSLEALISNEAIKQIIADMYIRELKRDPSEPFDPHALAVWGGMLYRQGTSLSVLRHFENALRSSSEWKEKNPDPKPKSHPLENA